MDIIAYHHNCPDGFTAAYIAKLRYPEAQLKPVLHGIKNNIEDYRDKNVLVVDFSFREVDGFNNDDVNQIAKSYRVFDHHKSEAPFLVNKSYAVFDLNRSGAGLTWDYLFGKDSEFAVGNFTVEAMLGYARPWWVNYVEDRDLWKHVLPKSREVNAYIMTFPYTIEGWNIMTKMTVEDAIKAGEAIHLQIQKYVREVSEQAIAGQIPSGSEKIYSALIVNAPYLNVSEVGENLAKKAEVGAAWFERADGQIQFSLRSKPGTDIDVSEIAKLFGGGGHKHAAGFVLEVQHGRHIIDFMTGRMNTIDIYRKI